jgi:hypothetical protein
MRLSKQLFSQYFKGLHQYCRSHDASAPRGCRRRSKTHHFFLVGVLTFFTSGL